MTSCVSKVLITWFVYFIAHVGPANAIQPTCSLLQGCSCLTTSDKKYEYRCKGFNATMASTQDLQISCNIELPMNVTQNELVTLVALNLETLAILYCPVAPLLKNFNNLATLKTLTLKGDVSATDNVMQLNLLPDLMEMEIIFSQINMTIGLFTNPKLRKLILAHNSIQWIPADIFKNTSKLTHLDLSYNEIEVLPENVFLRLRDLKCLNLEMNYLTNISSSIFYDLQDLEETNLSNNKIAFIHIEAFQRLINLKMVNLSNNYITLDDFSPFHSNLYLEKADLSYNRISHIANDLVVNKIYLEDLDLSYNQISYIELSNVLTVSQNAKIDLMHNKIETINFTGAVLLEQINALENIQQPQSYYTTTINFNDNPIKCDCSLYDFIEFLINGSTNIIVQINGANCASPQSLNDFPLSKLKLDMLTCPLETPGCPKSCQCDYREWDKTVVVDCSMRNLTMAPELRLTTNSNVRKIEVFLQDNFLTNGPVEDMGYENVTKLVVSNNQIQNITWVPPKLQTLEADHNNLTYLNYEVLLQLNSETLESLVLGNNPWECDCSAVAFNTFLVAQITSKQIDVNDIQCNDTQKLLIYFNSQDLCALSKPNVTVIALVISLVILSVSGLAISCMICKSRKKLRPKRSRMV